MMDVNIAARTTAVHEVADKLPERGAGVDVPVHTCGTVPEPRRYSPLTIRRTYGNG